MYCREELSEPTSRVEETFTAVRDAGRLYATSSDNFDELAQAAAELEEAARWLREEAESKADEADPEVEE